MSETKRDVVLIEQRLGLAEERRHDYVVNAAEGTTVEDVLKPGYWAYVSGKFTPYDRVDVRLETGEWLLELIVLDVGLNYVRMFLAKQHDFEEVASDKVVAAETHKVEWKGPQRKWIVLRLSDQAPVQEGFDKKGDAFQWMNNHIRVSTMT